MTDKEQQEWRDNLIEVLYPTIRERFFQEMKGEIARQVALNVGKWMDFPLTVKQVAKLLDVDFRTIYKWQERGTITLDKSGKKKYTISLKSLNSQLSGKKELMIELSGNQKSSKVKSRGRAREANSEQ